MKKLMIAAMVGSVLTMNQAMAQDAAAKPNWSEKITLKGDVRVRYESIDEEGKETRERGRVRARLGAYAQVNDEIDAAIALASGNDDPVSTNETFDNGFSTKDVGLDLAYIDAHPEWLGGGSVILGKMKMPFIAVNDLQWDGDLNPEGAALNLELPAGDALKLLVNGGGFWVEERSSDDETMLYGAQAAAEMKTDAFKMTAGASYFMYDNLEGFAPIFDAEDSFGNSVNTELDGEEESLTYAIGYEIVELFAKFAFDAGLPVELAGNYVMNQDADDNDTGYMLGVKLGKLKDAGSFDLGYSYRELEADAVLGVFADSDPWGGGTDGNSHKLSAGYQIAKHLSGHLTYFMSEKGLDDGKDYDRFQIDLIAKF
jgi:hypothetical protein